ncbi:hypothetical protein FRC14_000690 [Serendipita sp. 396]|nr:hypothetical protein FRC14_000690 [Serendipita sp. 396]
MDEKKVVLDPLSPFLDKVGAVQNIIKGWREREPTGSTMRVRGVEDEYGGEYKAIPGISWLIWKEARRLEGTGWRIRTCSGEGVHPPRNKLTDFELRQPPPLLLSYVNTAPQAERMVPQSKTPENLQRDCGPQRCIL